MNLALDIGNTRVKAGLFDRGRLFEKRILESPNAQAIQAIVEDHAVQHCILSQVGQSDLEIAALGVPGVALRLDERLELPIVNTYETPETLGKDRIAAVVAAWALFPKQDCLVIDAGTCITYDLLSADGHYLGGNIAPGLDMRFRAMHQFTAALPEVERRMNKGLMGRTTEQALQNGGVLGVLMEMGGYIEMLKMRYTEINVILTGGDSIFFAENLKTEIFVHPDLVLIGLDQILEFHVAKHN